jgi:hypothetical protein
MLIDERLAKARELIELGKTYLPLLARQRAAEEEATILEHQPAEPATVRKKQKPAADPQDVVSDNDEPLWKEEWSS